MADDGAAPPPTRGVRGLLVANLVAVLLFGTLTSLPWIGIGYCVFVDARQCPSKLTVASKAVEATDGSSASGEQQGSDTAEPASTPPASEAPPQKSDQERLLDLADEAEKAGTPAGSALRDDASEVLDQIVKNEKGQQTKSGGTFVFTDSLAREYRELFDTTVIAPEQLARVDRLIKYMTADVRRSAYAEVEKATGVPWYVIGALHNLEAGFNLRSDLQTGARLTEGSWSKSAIDAMRASGLAGQKDWGLELMLFRLEKFNGPAYRKHRVHTPYLWAGSNHYTKGKFVRDGAFDPEARSKQIGAAVIFKRLIQLGKISSDMSRTPLPPQPRIARGPVRVALIIGNGDYGRGVAPLKNAKADAQDVAKALRQRGFQVFGPKINIGRDEMFDVVEAFESAAEGADVALAWYAGHGFQLPIGESERSNMLIPADYAGGDDLIQKGFPLSRLVTAVTPALLPVVVVDACRDSGIGFGERGGERGFYPEERSGVLIVYSTRAGRTASDGDGRNSPFAASFLETFAANPSLDVRRLFAGVTKGTRERTKQRQVPEKIDRLEIPDELPLAQ